MFSVLAHLSDSDSSRKSTEADATAGEQPPVRRSSRALYREFREKLRKGDSFKDEEEEEKTSGNSKANFGAYLRFIYPFRWTILGVLTLALFAAILDMLMPLASGMVVDRIFQNGEMDALAKRRLLGLAGPGLLAAAFLARAMDAVRDYSTHGINTRIVSSLRLKLYQHLLSLPLDRIHQMKTGRAVSRVTSDTDAVTGLLQMGLISPTVAVLRIIVALAIVISWNTRLAVVLCILVVPLAGMSFLWIRPLRRLWDGWWRTKSKVDARLNETFAGLRVVRSFQQEHAETFRQQTGNHGVLRSLLYGVRLSAVTHIVWAFLIPATAAIVLWYGGNLYLSGRATIGQIMAFNAYAGMLMWPIYLIVGTFNDLQKSLASVDKVFEVLRQPSELADPPDALSAPDVVKSIRFEKLEFAYPNSEGKKVIDGIELDVMGGETVALVGPSGAGKTTLTDLVARFYPPTGGRILLNGEDLQRYQLHGFRRMLGVVSQEVFLFDGTVRENLAFARRDATSAEIEDAAMKANAHGFIVELKKGYDTVIGERGAKLSGGQRQRLSIARAILANPRILILDEATSNLDSESEGCIQAALEELRKGRTTFVIAHRLSTIANADRIVVLDKGKLVESGTHHDLMARNGMYAAMVARQRDAFEMHSGT